MTTWQQLLSEFGAVFENGVPMHFGNPGAELRAVSEGDVVADLSNLGLLAVSGADAGDFLQGQLTNDIRAVSGTHSQLSGICSHKGRLLATFRVFGSGETYYLQMPRVMLDDVAKRLRLYVLRARVSMDDAADRFVCLGILGQEAERVARELLGHLPQEADAMVTAEGIHVIRLTGDRPRYQLIGEPTRLEEAWRRLTAVATPVAYGAWDFAEVRAAVPVVLPETRDAFVPQMLNLEVLNGVSFTKGCYTGQEVVARSQYLGKLKRRMYLAHVEQAELPTPGTPIFDARDVSGQSAGRVVRSVASPLGGCDLLAVVQIEHARDGSLQLGAPGGAALRLMPLPYSLDAKD